MNKNITLTGDHIRLRPLTKDDLPLKVQWYNDPDIRKTLILDETLELGKTVQWFETVKDSPLRLDLIIETLEGHSVGVTGFVEISPKSQSAEIFIVIGEKEYWGRGVMLEAHQLLIDWGFENLMLRQILGVARLDNMGSIVTLKKLGFRQGVILEKDKVIAGKKKDIYQYVLEKESVSK